MAHRGGRRLNAGRPVGAKSKTTIEREERDRLEREADEALARKDVAEAAKRKLGKDVLEEIMRTLMGAAAAYQPPPPGYPPKAGADEALFFKYAIGTRDTAALLAKYQSPTYKAVAITMPVTPGDQKPVQPGDNAKVIDINANDPARGADAHRRLIAAAPVTLVPPRPIKVA